MKYIIGNWKMNPASLSDAKKIWPKVAAGAKKFKNVDTAICPPYPFIGLLGKKAGLKLGAQDCHFEYEGAFTGSVSAPMLKAAGAELVILGHSERRKAGDTDEIINKKIKAALKEGLKVIFCVGEEARDDGGAYLKELQRQLETGLSGLSKKACEQLIVAHEPVWAIGAAATGADSPEGFQHNRLFIKKILVGLFGKKNGLAIPVIYGGSANAKNAGDFLGQGGADGLLVGRAALSPEDFLKIIGIADSSVKEKK